MNAEQERRLNDLLVLAVEKTPAERRRYLEEACTGDEALLEEAFALLALEDNLDSFLETPAVEGVLDLLPPPPGEDEEEHEPELGSYRLEGLLGKGGMGEVYKAWDPRLGRWVAIKRLHRRTFHDPKARARFHREARTLAQVAHPAIVRIFEFLEEGGDDWIVMEFVEGPSLAEILARGPLEIGPALDYARQVASGLEAAHAEGIMHRDLKAENVMVVPSGGIKILDFGLAKKEGGTPGETSVSIPGQIMGTPRAMSPEQVEGQRADRRSDLFSFGVLLYELLTARSPFQGQWLYETLNRVTTFCPPPVKELDPRIPQPLSDLVDRLLEKDPDRRGDAVAAIRVLMSITADEVKLPAAPPAVPEGLLLRPIKREKTAADRPRTNLRSGGRPS